MLVTIFGAGASFDSVNARLVNEAANRPAMRPPLASELFADRELFSPALNAFPQIRALIPRLRGASSSGVTIEAELGKIQAEAAEYSKRHTQLAAVRFYLRTILTGTPNGWFSLSNGVTNYHALVDVLDEWSTRNNIRVAFLTFNYDTLLERAMRDENVLKPDSMQSYIEGERWQLHKLHGSVDWGRVVATNELLVGYSGGLERGMIEFAGELPITDEIVRIDGRSETNVDYCFPALAIPLEDKSAFECPPAHLEATRRALRDCERLLIVGWAGNDKHFLDLCKQEGLAPKRTLVVAGDEANGKAVAVKLAQIGIGRDVHVFPAGFSNLVEPGGADTIRTFLN